MLFLLILQTKYLNIFILKVIKNKNILLLIINNKNLSGCVQLTNKKEKIKTINHICFL